MDAKQQQLTSLRLVQLDHLVQVAVEQAYSDLQELNTQLPKQTDAEKKQSLLKHLHATRQRLQRLHIILQWCHKAPAVAECRRILDVVSSHTQSINEATRQLGTLKTEIQYSSVPAYDVMTAMHVLQTGSFDLLPSVIEDELRIPLSRKIEAKGGADLKNKAVARMEFLLRAKLLQEHLPEGLEYVNTHNGQITLRSTAGLYSATLTLVPSPSDQVTEAKYIQLHDLQQQTMSGGVPSASGGGVSGPLPPSQQQEQQPLPEEEKQPEVVEVKKEPQQQGTMKIKLKFKVKVDSDGPVPMEGVEENPKPQVQVQPEQDGNKAVATADVTAGSDKVHTTHQTKPEDDAVAIVDDANKPSTSKTNPTTEQQQVVSKRPCEAEITNWRWRLLHFEILPGLSGVKPAASVATIPPPLSPQVHAALQRDVEGRMWAATDVACLMQLGRRDLVVLPAPPLKEPAGGKKIGGMGAGNVIEGNAKTTTSTNPSSTTIKQEEHKEEEEEELNVPDWASKPLVAMHTLLQGVAGRAALNTLIRDEGRALENGSWKGRLKVAKVPEGRVGIRLAYWLDIWAITLEDLHVLTGQRCGVDNNKLEPVDIKQQQEGQVDDDARKHLPRPAMGHAVDVELESNGTLTCWSAPKMVNVVVGTDKITTEMATLDLGLKQLSHLANQSKPHSIPLLEHLLWSAAARAATMHLAAVYAALNTLIVSSLQGGGGGGQLVLSADLTAAVVGELGHCIVPPYLTLRDADKEALLHVSIDIHTGRYTVITAGGDDLKRPSQLSTAPTTSTATLCKAMIDNALSEGKTGPLPDGYTSRGVYTAVLISKALHSAARKLQVEKLWTAVAIASEGFGLKRITLAPLLSKEIMAAFVAKKKQSGGLLVDTGIDSLALLLPQPPPGSSSTGNTAQQQVPAGVLLGSITTTVDTSSTTNAGTTKDSCWHLAICKATKKGAPLSLHRLVEVPDSVVGVGSSCAPSGGGRAKRKREDEEEELGIKNAGVSETIDIGSVLEWCKEHVQLN